MSNKKQEFALDALYQKFKHKFNGSSTKLLIKTKPKISELLKESSIKLRDLNLSSLEYEQLLREKMICYTNEKEGLVCISLKGIVIKETDGNIDKFLDELNKEFIELGFALSQVKLQTKEKIVLLSLLGIGAVSKKYPLDISKNNKEKAWEECISEVVEFSKKQKLFDQSDLMNIWPSAKREEGHNARALMSRLNEKGSLVNKSGNVYNILGSKYCLDIVSDGSINNKNLDFVIKKVFEEIIIDVDLRKKINELIKELNQKYAYRVFDSIPIDHRRFYPELKFIIETL